MLCSADLKYSKRSEETKLGDASMQIRGLSSPVGGPTHSYSHERCYSLVFSVGPRLKFHNSASRSLDAFCHDVMGVLSWCHFWDVTVLNIIASKASESCLVFVFFARPLTDSIIGRCYQWASSTLAVWRERTQTWRCRDASTIFEFCVFATFSRYVTVGSHEASHWER